MNNNVNKMQSSPLFYLLLCLIPVSWRSSTETTCNAIALPSSAALRTSSFLRPIRLTQGKSNNAAQLSIRSAATSEEEMEEEVKIIGAMIPGDPYVTATVTQGIASVFSFYNTILLVRLDYSFSYSYFICVFKFLCSK